MKESRFCSSNSAFKLFHKLLDFMSHNSQKASGQPDTILNNNEQYTNLMPKLVAIFIIADGIIAEDQIDLASDLIINDELIEDKEKAFKLIKNTMDEMLNYISKSYCIFTLKINSLINELAMITNVILKERFN